MSRLGLRTLNFLSMDVDEAGDAAVQFQPRSPLGFRAGQHGLWLVPGGGIKAFTIASAPQEDLVTLGTNLLSQSRFKRALQRLTPGAAVRLIGPLGSFSLDDITVPVVMLAQGMGVTPFRAMLRQAALTGAGPHVTLVHVGDRHPFRADTDLASVRAGYPTSREAFTRAVQAVTQDRPAATYMLSGAPAFVAATAALLATSGVPASQIRRDKFYGYAPAPARELSTAR